MRLLGLLLLLTACGDATGPVVPPVVPSRIIGTPAIPGKIPPITLCMDNPLVAQVAGFPVCP